MENSPPPQPEPQAPVPTPKPLSETFVQALIAPFQVGGKFVASNSVAITVFLGGVGFLISGGYYFRRGVSAIDLPAAAWFAAGLAWLVLTLLPVWLGHAAATHWTERRSAGRGFTNRLIVALIAAFSANYLLSLLRIWAVGPLFYGLFTFFTGFSWARWFHPSFLDPDLVFRPRPASIENSIVVLILHASLFSSAVYPVLPKSFGGGAPVPVVIRCGEPCSTTIAGLHTFEVFQNATAYYVAIEYPPGTRRDDARREILVDWSAGPIRHVQFPRSTITEVTYLENQADWALDAGTTDAGNLDARAAFDASTKSAADAHDAGGVLDGGTSSGGPDDAGDRNTPGLLQQRHPVDRRQ